MSVPGFEHMPLCDCPAPHTPPATQAMPHLQTLSVIWVYRPAHIFFRINIKYVSICISAHFCRSGPRLKQSPIIYFKVKWGIPHIALKEFNNNENDNNSNNNTVVIMQGSIVMGQDVTIWIKNVHNYSNSNNINKINKTMGIMQGTILVGQSITIWINNRIKK